MPCAIHTDYHTAGWRTKVKGVPGMLPTIRKLETLNQEHIAFCNTGHNSAMGWFVAGRDEDQAGRQQRCPDSL